MSCYHPWSLQLKDGRAQMVPCRWCIGCLLERQRGWAMRIMHEAALHEHSEFWTLTVAPEEEQRVRRKLSTVTLVPDAFRLLVRRVRRSGAPGASSVRYFHSGEYGEEYGRPHYHAVVFGMLAPSREGRGSRGGHPVFTSGWLHELWPYGHHEIGSVTMESASYVAGYVVKKFLGGRRDGPDTVVDAETGEVIERHPEYARMSRRPGIGAGWIAQYRDEVYQADSVVVRGVECKPPRYYDVKAAQVDPLLVEDAKWRRFLRAKARGEAGGPGLDSEEVVALAKFTQRGN